MTLIGRNPRSVLELLQKRRSASYCPGDLSDGNRLALVVEGGAMAGLMSAASAAALQELGFTNCFDAVYGTSAGAVNAAYFVAGQSELCIRMYLEEVIASDFIRVWRWPNQIDVEWLARNVVSGGPKKLNLDAIAITKTDLCMSMTDVKTGAVRFYSTRESGIEKLVAAIKASGSTPLFTTHTENIDGELYNDGMLRAALPVAKAIEDSNTHIVILTTKPYPRVKRFNLLYSIIEYALRIRKYSLSYQSAYFAHARFYNDSVNYITDKSNSANTIVLAPVGKNSYPRHLEKNSVILSRMAVFQKELIRKVIVDQSNLA